MRHPVQVLFASWVLGACAAGSGGTEVTPMSFPTGAVTSEPSAGAAPEAATAGAAAGGSPAVTPTAEADATWLRYDRPEHGFAIALPADWRPMPEGAYANARQVVFGASPEPDRASFGQYRLSVMVLRFAPLPSGWAADDLATHLASTALADAGVERDVAEHESGRVAVLRYVVDAGGVLAQQTDVVFARGGVGWVLGLRAPFDRVEDHAPTLDSIFDAFRPG